MCIRDRLPEALGIGVQVAEPAKRPTMYFVGVTTGQSSIMKMFPIWAKELGLDAEIKGIDLPIHAPAEDYQMCIRDSHRTGRAGAQPDP